MRLSFASVLVLCSVLPHFAFSAGPSSSGGGDALVATMVADIYKEIHLQQEAGAEFDKETKVLRRAQFEIVDSKPSPMPDEIQEVIKQSCEPESKFLSSLNKKGIIVIHPDSSIVRINRKAWTIISKDESAKGFMILYTAYKFTGYSDEKISEMMTESLKRTGKCRFVQDKEKKPNKAKPAPSAPSTGGVDGQG